MAELIWFPHMVSSTHTMARACSSCTATGKNLTCVSSKAATLPREPVTAPGDELGTDVRGPITSNPTSQMYVLVAVDRFSRFPFATCTSSPTSDTVLHFLTEFIHMFGVPRRIRSNQGSAFVSGDLKHFCTRHNIRQVFSPVADHRGTGSVERLVRTLRERSGTCRTPRHLALKTTSSPSSAISALAPIALRAKPRSWHSSVVPLIPLSRTFMLFHTLVFQIIAGFSPKDSPDSHLITSSNRNVARVAQCASKAPQGPKQVPPHSLISLIASSMNPPSLSHSVVA